MARQIQELEERLFTLMSNPGIDDIDRISKSIQYKAEQQRRDIGGSYAVANLLVKTSKEFIKALKYGDLSKADEFRKIFADLWKELENLDLPLHFASEKDTEAGGEVVEAEGVFHLAPLLHPEYAQDRATIEKQVRKVLQDLWYKMGDPKADDILAELVATEEAALPPEERHHKLSIPFPGVLAGLGDVIGELSKFVKEMLLAHELEEGPALRQEEKKLLIKRFIFISRTVYEFLDRFETCYGMVINASQRPGWHNTYRAMLGRAAGLIGHYEDILMEMVLRETK